MRTEDEPDEAMRADVNAKINQLHAEYGHLLKRKLTRICRQKDRLDDLVQEAFMGLRQVLLDAKEPVRDPMALLYTIAGRVMTNQLRHERRVNQLCQPMDASASQVPDLSVGGEQAVLRSESLHLRLQVINDLPSAQQRVLRLALQGLTSSEIAQEMQLKPERIYRLRALALARCQRRARDLGLDDEY